MKKKNMKKPNMLESDVCNSSLRLGIYRFALTGRVLYRGEVRFILYVLVKPRTSVV